MSLVKHLFGMDGGDDDYNDDDDDNEKGIYVHTNHWEKLIKENSKYETYLIDWQFEYCDLLVFNCSSRDIRIICGDENICICSYIDVAGSRPPGATFKLGGESKIKIICDDKAVYREVSPKTVLYLEDKDLYTA